MLDYSRFEALTFDCYGTLIDWETGLVDAFRPVLAAHGVEAGAEDLLARYARYEAELEAGPYLSYRELVARACAASPPRSASRRRPRRRRRSAAAVADWPAFPDSARRARAARGALPARGDHELRRRPVRGVATAGSASTFDWVVTAQQAGAYKPDERPFALAFERIGLPRERILHVAQSLFHDHVTAKRLGLATVWIDRRGGREGTGATPSAAATPDTTYPDMASFAAAATAHA